MIREATEGDAAEIAKIYNYYILNTVATFEEESVDASDIYLRMKKVKESGFSWLVAENNGVVIGYAYSSKWKDRAAYGNTAEVSLYLSDMEKSQGWGTRLYDVLFSKLRSQSIHIVIGGITLPNQASIAIHEKYGMHKAAHFKEVGYKFGRWLDVGYWQVQLNTSL